MVCLVSHQKKETVLTEFGTKLHNRCAAFLVQVRSAHFSCFCHRTMSQMYVVKRDGNKQEVKFDSITRRIQQLCEGLDSEYIDPVPVTQKVIEGRTANILAVPSRPVS